MSKRILVVEDQEDNRQIIRDLLSATDYEVTEAESGEAAHEAVAKQRPDLILMDIQLPGMDGYETTRRINLYLPAPVYEALRKIAYDERVKIHDIVIEGLDAALRRRGYQSVESLKAGKKR